MQKADLLARLTSHLESLEKHQGFIDRAHEAADRFSPEVIEKVVRENTEKIEAARSAGEPLLPELRTLVGSLESERDAVHAGAADARLKLEELELRRMIGEIDDSTFDDSSNTVRQELGEVDTKVAAIDADIEELRTAITAWEARAGSSSDLGAAAGSDAFDAAEDDLLGSLDDSEDDLLGISEEEIEASGAFPAAEPLSVGDAYASGASSSASDAFADADDAFAGAAEDAFADQDQQDDLLVGGAETVRVTDDISSLFEAPPENEELLLNEELGGAPAPAELVLGEGTPEEQRYPFTGEVMSIGRNRDNTIQVKNDSKVSRYHCKVSLRDGYYIVEDNKSANGTLVDNQLITEKRLHGGEELIVGESMFRFVLHS